MRLIAIAALAFSTAIVPANARIVPGKVVGWAHVNFDGTITRGLNVVSVAHPSEGTFQVYFRTNVRYCAVVGTPQVPVSLSVIAGDITDKEVTVSLRGFDGFSTTDAAFFLMATC